MSATIRRYVAERENFEFNRGLNETESAASKLRQAFLKKFIIGFDTNLYKTQEERDWAYIAKRYIPLTQRVQLRCDFDRCGSVCHDCQLGPLMENLHPQEHGLLAIGYYPSCLLLHFTSVCLSFI